MGQAATQNMNSDSDGFICSRRGQHHAEISMAYGPRAPALYHQLPEADRETRAELTTDLCIIDEEHFFIVGKLELPVQDTDKVFSWDVWASLSRDNFMRTCELWESDDRVDEPPYFGWLSSSLPGYPETLSLKTHVHTREVGRRPYIEIEPTDHPLAIEQRGGITMDRVKEIAEMVLHPNG